jgi:hypothetical protein
MEAAIILGLLLTLAVLAPRFGKDSHNRPISDEERFGQLGFSWGCAETRPAGGAPARPRRYRGLAGPATAWCASLARKLAAAARRPLSPGEPGDVVWPTLRDYPYASRPR